MPWGQHLPPAGRPVPRRFDPLPRRRFPRRRAAFHRSHRGIRPVVDPHRPGRRVRPRHGPSRAQPPGLDRGLRREPCPRLHSLGRPTGGPDRPVFRHGHRTMELDARERERSRRCGGFDSLGPRHEPQLDLPCLGHLVRAAHRRSTSRVCRHHHPSPVHPAPNKRVASGRLLPERRWRQ